MANGFSVVHTVVRMHACFFLFSSFLATCKGADGIKGSSCKQYSKRALYLSAPLETSRPISRPTATSRHISRPLSTVPKKLLKQVQTRLVDCIRPAGNPKILAPTKKKSFNKVMETPIESYIQPVELAQELKKWKAETAIATAIGDLELCVTRIVNYFLQQKLEFDTPEDCAKIVKEFAGEQNFPPLEIQGFVHNMISDVWIRRKSDASQPLVESYLKNEYAMYKRYGASFAEIVGELSKYTHALNSKVMDYSVEVEEAGSSIEDSYSSAVEWYAQAKQIIDTIKFLQWSLEHSSNPERNDLLSRQLSHIRIRCGDARVFELYHDCALNKRNAEETLKELLANTLDQWEVNKNKRLFESTQRIYGDLRDIIASNHLDGGYASPSNENDPPQLIPVSSFASGLERKRSQRRKSVLLRSTSC